MGLFPNLLLAANAKIPMEILDGLMGLLQVMAHTFFLVAKGTFPAVDLVGYPLPGRIIVFPGSGDYNALLSTAGAGLQLCSGGGAGGSLKHCTLIPAVSGSLLLAATGAGSAVLRYRLHQRAVLVGAAVLQAGDTIVLGGCFAGVVLVATTGAPIIFLMWVGCLVALDVIMFCAAPILG